jgi:hypothetical protein
LKVEIIIGGLLATAFWVVVELFYRPDAFGLWEVIKLIVQFAGALLIARLTVGQGAQQVQIGEVVG